MATLTIIGDAIQMTGAARIPSDASWPGWLRDANAKGHSDFGAVHQMVPARAWFLMTAGGRVVVADRDWLVRDAGGEIHRFSDETYQRLLLRA